METKIIKLEPDFTVINKLTLTEEQESIMNEFLESKLNNRKLMEDLLTNDKDFLNKVKTDVFLNSLIGISGYSVDLSDLNNLNVSYLDYGWDHNIDFLSTSVGEVMDKDDCWIECPENIDWSRLKTLRLLDYYNDFSRLMVSELENIFGFAQECYLGYTDNFTIGFDVEGGSVVTTMPITNKSCRFKLTEFSENDRHLYCSDGWYKMLFKPGKTFYGEGKDHFYNTANNLHRHPFSRCEFAEIDIRLD